MRRWVFAALGAALLVAAAFAARPLRTRFGQLAADLQLIQGDTGDVMAGASYQRFRARREAVAAMQADLRWLARAESAFIADSGRPTTVLPPQYGRPTGRGNIGPYIELHPNAWSAKINNAHAALTCSIVATLDTTSGQYVPGEPRCFAERPDTLAVAAVPTRDVVPPPPPPPPPQPRPARDWGPVNNTPPPSPWIASNVCPGEYCALGRWAACSTITAYREKRTAAAPVFTIRPGEAFTALAGDMHVDVPGIVVFRDLVATPQGIDSIVFTPADTLFLLMHEGEGSMQWWFRGRVVPGYQFWGDDPSEPLPQRDGAVTLVRRPVEVWWVRVRNAEGREGWIVHTFYRMARDDRMDELSRCLR